MNILNKKKLTKIIALTAAVGAGQVYSAALEEVLVTAQKREQSVQEVPIAITSIGGEDLKNLGFKSATDVQFQTPGLIVSYASSNAIPNFTLRGVGLNDFTAVQSSPVAIHVDDIYYGNSTLLNFALFDVNRVEVLKGPQGTLYGRNSTGGAVNFFSNKPTQEFEAGIDLGIANYDAITAEGFVSGPLSDDLSGRVSVTTVNQSGGPYKHAVHGEIGDVEKYAVRAQLLWDATEKLTIHASMFGGSEESDAGQYHSYPTFAGDGSWNVCAPIAAGNLTASSDCYYDPDTASVGIDDNDAYTTDAGIVNRDEIDVFGVSVSVNYDMGDYTLTSITGYNTVDRKSQEDADGSPFRSIDVGYETEFEQLTEELRLSYDNGSGWNSTLGLFLSTDTLDTPRTETDLTEIYGGFRQNHSYELETDSAAIFWHNEYELTDALTAVLGLRYTDETRKFVGGTFNNEPGVGPDASGDFVPAPLLTSDLVYAFLDDEVDFKESSYRIGLNYDLNDSTMIYASVANGFKSGGFIGDITEQAILEQPYDEETLTAYELGFKSDLLDGSLRWNGSAFYYDYEDVILAMTIEGGALATLLINENASDAVIKGFETDVWWAPTDNIDIKLGAVYLDTEQEAIATEPFEVAAGRDGAHMPYAPEVSGNGLIRYSNTVADGLMGSVQLDFTTRAHHYAEIDNSKISKIDGYTLFNARVSLDAEESSWSASLWVKNIADKEYTQYINDLQGLGAVLTTPSYPRTYGVDLSLRF
ncbi:TonB-dependent receptor [Dasania sp. GY-MA-18]|uniref:TonB-dependent receptor n=1 Tax=Dasania phycosphaerae TaxID=2950436 RepID=A0A9J6RLJ0_9GAMM|nr:MULTISPECIES: TonB-dependent receptor [Dasania]MCR8922625.1 TonB-dependent receptor [Dasania sp. GY-MA-18]MCZ0865055.1 TonB-dependent receptor [Dasania phycosphaerae]MCZ0868781.1 TonB-dependent receptor [Dasania phycosphaerae]